MAIDLRALKAKCQQQAGDRWPQVYEAAVAANAASDLCCYGLWVHGKHPTLRMLAESRHFLLWATLLGKHRQLLLVSPPEHGKSVTMRWHIEQWIGQQTEMMFSGIRARKEPVGATPSATPETASSATLPKQEWEPSSAGLLAPTALLVMNTADQVERQIMSIAATIEDNRRYHQLFPHVKPNKNWGWTKDKLYCQRSDSGTALPDPTLQGTGFDGPIQGTRIGLCVVDDLTDQKDARSDTQLQKQKEWHQGVLDDRVLPDGLKRDICTRWSRNDIAQMLMEADTWHSVVLPAVNQLEADQQSPIWPESYPEYPWGRELWPELWPADRLDKKRKEKMLVENSLLWNLAYMCNPTDTGGNLFRREWFQYSDVPDEFAGALAA